MHLEFPRKRYRSVPAHRVARRILSIWTVGLLCMVNAPADTAISLPTFHETLDNGLQVLIVPDTSVAVVSCRLYYFVGSMYEYPGISGLSHMFEHMMFKGTKTLGTRDYEKEKPLMRQIDTMYHHILRLRDKGVAETDDRIRIRRDSIMTLLERQRRYIKKNEIWELYSSSGADNLNAWTADDLTAYIVTLPANKTELFYWIESDRMANRVLREFYSERNVVAQERKMRYDNKPVNRYWERLNALFYLAHPYRLPTIGWASDIAHYTREKLRTFISRYYTPDNALIVLAGNVDTTQAIQDIERYFGSIPPASKPQRKIVTREPEPIGVRSFTVYDDATPRIDILFHTPGYPHEDLYALDIIEGALSGRSGRLYERLVKQEGLCTDAGAGNAYRQHNGYFHIWAQLTHDAPADTVAEIIRRELQRLHTSAPDSFEIERTKNNITMHFVKRVSRLEGLSDQLAWFESLGHWQDLFTYPEKIARVEPEQVKAAASRYLRWEHRTIGRLCPAAQKPAYSTTPASTTSASTTPENRQ